MIDLYNGDCLEVMDKLIADNVKVDAIITDPPYGTTKCKWNSAIPFEPMWERLNKLVKDNGAIVLFGSEPFSSALRMSNIKNYKYDWIWNKITATGFCYARYQPMRQTENISVFCGKNKRTNYNPQMVELDKPIKYKNSGNCKVYDGITLCSNEYKIKTHNFPKTLITYSNANHTNKLHPTQKPVALLEYLVKTYTNEGDTVLDFTMGSGTTGVACKNLNRNFIGIDLDENYYNIAKERINDKKDLLSFNGL